MSNDSSITCYEYLRPENTREERIYDVPATIADKSKQLAVHDIHCCCDVYRDGSCRVYLYSNQYEGQVGKGLRAENLSIADIMAREVIANFDLASI